MLQYERIDISEGIDINKSNKSKKHVICNHWHFKEICYTFEAYVCHKCHDISMMVYDLDDFIILNIHGVDYRCFVCNMRKTKAIKLLNNSKLDD